MSKEDEKRKIGELLFVIYPIHSIISLSLSLSLQLKITFNNMYDWELWTIAGTLAMMVYTMSSFAVRFSSLMLFSFSFVSLFHSVGCGMCLCVWNIENCRFLECHLIHARRPQCPQMEFRYSSNQIEQGKSTINLYTVQVDEDDAEVEACGMKKPTLIWILFFYYSLLFASVCSSERCLSVLKTILNTFRCGLMGI